MDENGVKNATSISSSKLLTCTFLVDAPGREDRAEELEAADVQASIRLPAFRQPDPEAVRGDSVGGAHPPKSEALSRHRTREVAELAPVLTVESFERPICKAL